MSREAQLRFDPRLMEEAVFFTLRGNPKDREFHRHRGRLYEIEDPEERDKAFHDLNREWFLRLGLARPIERAFEEQPLLLAGVRSCVVGPAAKKKDEGAELFVSPDEGLDERERRSVRLLLGPESLLDPSSLETFLRHEFYHIADMLDPQFGYERNLPPAEGGPIHDRLFKERYRVLWDTIIDGRMVRRGWAPDSFRADRFSEFCQAFSMLREDSVVLFSFFFDQDPHTHIELVAFATDPRAGIKHPPATPHAGSRCPLCGFPTYAFEPKPDLLPSNLVAQIAQDFPGWQPSHGLCAQCADLYRARRISVYAAMSLPGLHPDRASG